VNYLPCYATSSLQWPGFGLQNEARLQLCRGLLAIDTLRLKVCFLSILSNEYCRNRCEGFHLRRSVRPSYSPVADMFQLMIPCACVIRQSLTAFLPSSSYIMPVQISNTHTVATIVDCGPVRSRHVPKCISPIRN